MSGSYIDGYPVAGTAPAFDGVVAPSPTSEKVASGSNLTAKTFSAFIDPNGLIASYSITVTNADGTCSWTDGGSNNTLGPYSATSADGDSGTLACHALDSSGNVLATAYHSFDRAAAGGGGKSWSNIASVDYTASSTGALSSGTAVIGGVTHDVTIPASCTATDDANGVRVSKTGGGFFYIGVDVATLATDIEKPFRVAWALNDITIASGGNVGAAVYSAATPDASVRAPSVQDRINNAAATYTDQPLHTTGAVGAGASFTNPGSGSLVGAVSSCVIEVYVWGSMAAVKLTTATTTIPAATDPVDVFTNTAYRIMSLATGGEASGSNPSFWPNAWGSVVIGSGSAVAIDADIVTLSIDEWG